MPFPFQGCELNCPDGYRVQVDLKTKQWECIPEEDNFICPGKLELDCPNDPKEVSCGCKNEVRKHHRYSFVHRNSIVTYLGRDSRFG